MEDKYGITSPYSEEFANRHGMGIGVEWAEKFIAELVREGYLKRVQNASKKQEAAENLRHQRQTFLFH